MEGNETLAYVTERNLEFVKSTAAKKSRSKKEYSNLIGAAQIGVNFFSQTKSYTHGRTLIDIVINKHKGNVAKWAAQYEV